MVAHNKAKKHPRGRMKIELYNDGSPIVEMSGDIKPNDIHFAITSLRRGLMDHLNKVGEANKKKQAEKDRIEKDNKSEFKIRNDKDAE